MICEKLLQIKVQRFLLQLVGLWPYKQSQCIRRLVVLQLILFYSILVTFIIFQLITIATSECKSQIIIEIISILCVSITYVVMYNSYIFNMNIVKNLLEILQYIYNGLKDQREISIIRKYGMASKHITILLTGLTLSSIIVVTAILFWTQILDIILPLNESRQHLVLQITTKSFVNQEKYLYLIELHILVAFSIGGIVMLATGTMSITYLQYACGMFNIASYRIEQAIKVCGPKHNKNNKNLAFVRIVYAVDMHRKAMEYVHKIEAKSNIWYVIMAVVQVISACCNLFRIFEGILLGYHFYKLVTFFIFLISSYALMFCGNYFTQQITDSNDYVFATAYNADWYIAPLQIQKFILFLLQRGTKVFNMKVGGLFVGSLESFATLLSSSISYFTVLYSTRL